MNLNTMVNRLFGGTAQPTRPTGPPRRNRNNYCLLLQPSYQHSHAELDKLWAALEKEMALVPGGAVCLSTELVDESGEGCVSQVERQLENVATFYVDRHVVSQADYLEFVRQGGYTQHDYWASEAHAKLNLLVDRTGEAGPRFWEHGKPPRDRLEHPVVGICWYEADAFARWRGKSLPTPAQWQRAASWHHDESSSTRSERYPWGATFDTSKANSWASGLRRTAAVDQYYDGTTPNGVYQLVGNVWEWTSAQFLVFGESRNQQQGELMEIRGGAFDTYLDSQLTTDFRSAQPKLIRADNIGFRCVVEASQLQQPNT